MNTREDLVIVWNCEDGQEERRGLYFYGLFPLAAAENYQSRVQLLFDPMNAKCQSREILHELGTVGMLAIRIDIFPDSDAWMQILDEVFSTMLAAGASVAWAGGEDCSWSPEVLDPNSGIGNVYAAKSATTGVLCNCKLDEPIEFLTDRQLSRLWKAGQRNS